MIEAAELRVSTRGQPNQGIVSDFDNGSTYLIHCWMHLFGDDIRKAIKQCNSLVGPLGLVRQFSVIVSQIARSLIAQRIHLNNQACKRTKENV